MRGGIDEMDVRFEFKEGNDVTRDLVHVRMLKRFLPHTNEEIDRNLVWDE